MNKTTSEAPLGIQKRVTAWLFFFVFLGIALLHLSSISNELNSLGGDNAGYILSACSLSEFNGFRSTKPGYPPKTHHQPIFSVLLAPAIYLFGVNFSVIHAIVVLTELVMLLLFFFFFKRLAGYPVALTCTLMFGLNQFVNLSLVRILSEFPYMMITGAGLLLASRSEESGNRAIQYFWLPLTIAAAYMTRMAGLSFLVGFFLYRLHRKQFRLLLWNIPILILPRLLWMLRAKMYEQGEGYFGYAFVADGYDPAKGYVDVPALVERFHGNVKKISQGFSEFVFPMGDGNSMAILLVISALCLGGFYLRWHRKQSGFLEFYVIVYLALLVVWPVYEPRKVLPIVPILYFYFFLAMKVMAEKIFHLVSSRSITNPQKPSLFSTPSLIVGVISILLISGQILPTLNVVRFRMTPLYYPLPGDQKFNNFSIDWSHFRESYYMHQYGNLKKFVLAWSDYLYLSHLAGQITPENSAIVARKRTLTSLYSGRPAMHFPFYRDYEKQYRFIMEWDMEYVLLDGMFKETREYLMPFIETFNESFTTVAESGRARLLKIDKEKLSGRYNTLIQE